MTRECFIIVALLYNNIDDRNTIYENIAKLCYRNLN